MISYSFFRYLKFFSVVGLSKDATADTLRLSWDCGDSFNGIQLSEERIRSFSIQDVCCMCRSTWSCRLALSSAFLTENLELRHSMFCLFSPFSFVESMEFLTFVQYCMILQRQNRKTRQALPARGVKVEFLNKTSSGSRMFFFQSWIMHAYHIVGRSTDKFDSHPQNDKAKRNQKSEPSFSSRPSF